MTDDAQCGSMPCSSGLSQRMLAAQACDQQGQVGSSLGDGQAAACSAELDGDIVSSNSAVAAVAQARSFVPAATASYLQPDYWDARFGEEDAYEWCKDYSEFRHLVAPELVASDRVLELGCGNSGLGAALAADGLKRVTCTDLSGVVVQRMQRKATACASGVHYQVADMLRLPFPDGSFDVVIEKGALEVFFTDSPSAWEPTLAARQRFAKAVDEAHRVLAPDGVLMSVSFGQPHFRVPLLLACGRHTWDCRVERFGGSFDYFVYVLRKGRRQAAAAHKQQGGDAEADLLGVALGPQVRARSPDQEAPMHEHMDDEGYLTHMML